MLIAATGMPASSRVLKLAPAMTVQRVDRPISASLYVASVARRRTSLRTSKPKPRVQAKYMRYSDLANGGRGASVAPRWRWPAISSGTYLATDRKPCLRLRVTRSVGPLGRQSGTRR
jgi:hypothetical protein